MRWPVQIVGAVVFAGVAASAGLIGAGGGYVLSQLLVELIPGLRWDFAFVGSLILFFPPALWVQFRLVKVVQPKLARLERRLARRSTIAYEQVVEPFTLLLRAFSDDETIANRSPKNPIGALSVNRLETWIVDALRPIGPVLAVGLPGEVLPHTGAARLYLDENLWQERIQSLIRRSRATIIIVGEGPGVWWEVKAALGAIAATPLAFVFPMRMKPKSVHTGFVRRDEVPPPAIDSPLFKRLQSVLREAGLGSIPESGPRDQILVLDSSRRPRFLKTRMTGRYYAFAINPVILLLQLICWLFPSFPWRASFGGEISYKRTLAPFVRTVLSSRGLPSHQASDRSQ